VPWRPLAAGSIAIAAALGAAVAWRADAGGPRQVAVPATDTLDGEWLFQVKGCAGCHVAGRGSGYPDLSQAGEWAGERRAGMSAEAYLAESIRDPQAFISPQWMSGDGRPGMPDLTVSEAEIDALVEHLLED